MLSVILLILKIIGIAILVLLGLILVLILTVLFVPVRYRVKAEHGDSLDVDGGISWLLHLLHARIRQSGKERRIWIRVLGILVYDSLRPPKSKKKRTGKASKVKASKADAGSEDSKHRPEDEIKESTKVSNADREEDITVEDGQKPGNTTTDSVPEAKITAGDPVQKDKAGSKDSSENMKKEKNSPCGIIKRVYIKVKTKIIHLFNKIKNKLKELLQKLLNIKSKINLILSFIRDDGNKESFRFTYVSLKKIIKHILPRKLKSKLIFGTGDPCSTGQALGAFGILYSIYGDSLQITPDFENKVFKGSHYARGRIRIGTILIIAIKLLLDKRFKELRMNFQQLKEAL